jgi:hypothetical protein
VFFNGDLNEKIFMLQLEGFVVKRKKECLKKHFMT